jgi:formylglycine-generating enzyme required for sulfatase activity
MAIEKEKRYESAEAMRTALRALRQELDMMAMTPSQRYPGAGFDDPVAGTLMKNSLGIEFIWVPSGEFVMGWADGLRAEMPLRVVRISRGFYMGSARLRREHGTP